MRKDGTRPWRAAGIACTLLLGLVSCSGSRAGGIGDARVPAGYRLETLATDLGGPRLMAFAPDGALVIGTRSGTVWRLEPPYRHATPLLHLSNYPHSVAFRDGNILVAQNDGIYRAPYAPDRAPLDAKLWVRLPAGGGHTSRTVGVGPDGRVYAALGLSGNCSDQYIGPPYDFRNRRGGVMVLDESGAEPRWRPFATGLRNPVGFDWQPETGVLYATNNGPDHHGFDEPAEYFVRARAGDFFGLPWYVLIGGRIVRDDCVTSDPPHPVSDVKRPVATFPARNAPLGMAFARTGPWAGDALVALHGSWATQPYGGSMGPDASRRPPAIVRVHFEHGQATGRVTDVVTGFQDPDSGDRWARPAGVAVGPDGFLYFTSDQGANALFRLRPVDDAATTDGGTE